MKRKITAYGDQGQALFFRLVQNKAEARKAVINHPSLALVSHVIYNNKRVELRDIYAKWEIIP